MKITTIAYSGSNPSMGPYDTSSSRSLNMEGYPQELEDLLDHTQVNGAVSLREYLNLRLQDDQEGVQKVDQSFDCGDLREGERIIDLSFCLQDGPTIVLKDLRRFSLEGSGMQAFDALIREKGTVSSSSLVDDIGGTGSSTGFVAPEVSEAPRPEQGPAGDA
jgi:hypothetical protein